MIPSLIPKRIDEKQQLFFIFFIFYSVFQFAFIINPPTKSTNLTPSNTVFMFDVDGILIKRGFWENWQEYWHIIRDCNFFDVFKFLGWHLLHLPSLANNLIIVILISILMSSLKSGHSYNKKLRKALYSQELSVQLPRLSL